MRHYRYPYRLSKATTTSGTATLRCQLKVIGGAFGELKGSPDHLVTSSIALHVDYVLRRAIGGAMMILFHMVHRNLTVDASGNNIQPGVTSSPSSPHKAFLASLWHS